MQAAHAADGFVAGAQVEVVGVAENDFGAQRFERCPAVTALTVPAVPTGMKTGVSTVRWGRWICARRPPASVVGMRLKLRPT